MKKCRACNGQKYVTGMGNMRDKCKACDGKGFISDDEQPKAKTDHKKK